VTVVELRSIPIDASCCQTYRMASGQRGKECGATDRPHQGEGMKATVHALVAANRRPPRFVMIAAWPATASYQEWLAA